MRIGLLSDTHSWLDPRIRTHFTECDEIWQAGDIGTEAVADELESWKPVRAITSVSYSTITFNVACSSTTK